MPGRAVLDAARNDEVFHTVPFGQRTQRLDRFLAVSAVSVWRIDMAASVSGFAYEVWRARREVILPNIAAVGRLEIKQVQRKIAVGIVLESFEEELCPAVTEAVDIVKKTKPCRLAGQLFKPCIHRHD